MKSNGRLKMCFLQWGLFSDFTLVIFFVPLFRFILTLGLVPLRFLSRFARDVLLIPCLCGSLDAWIMIRPAVKRTAILCTCVFFFIVWGSLLLKKDPFPDHSFQYWITQNSPFEHHVGAIGLSLLFWTRAAYNLLWARNTFAFIRESCHLVAWVPPPAPAPVCEELDEELGEDIDLVDEPDNHTRETGCADPVQQNALQDQISKPTVIGREAREMAFEGAEAKKERGQIGEEEKKENNAKDKENGTIEKEESENNQKNGRTSEGENIKEHQEKYNHEKEEEKQESETSVAQSSSRDSHIVHISRGPQHIVQKREIVVQEAIVVCERTSPPSRRRKRRSGERSSGERSSGGEDLEQHTQFVEGEGEEEIQEENEEEEIVEEEIVSDEEIVCAPVSLSVESYVTLVQRKMTTLSAAADGSGVGGGEISLVKKIWNRLRASALGTSTSDSQGSTSTPTTTRQKLHVHVALLPVPFYWNPCLKKSFFKRWFLELAFFFFLKI